MGPWGVIMEVLLRVWPQLLPLFKQPQRLAIVFHLKFTYPLRHIINNLQIDPFRIQQIINLFIVDLHIRNISRVLSSFSLLQLCKYVL